MTHTRVTKGTARICPAHDFTFHMVWPTYIMFPRPTAHSIGQARAFLLAREIPTFMSPLAEEFEGMTKWQFPILDSYFSGSAKSVGKMRYRPYF